MTARNQALFCMITGQSPDTYLRLTQVERDEFLEAAKKLHGK